MTNLFIRCEYMIAGYDEFSYGDGITYKPPKMTVTVTFELRGHLESFLSQPTKFIWTLEAPHSHNEQELRRELLKNQRMDFEVHSQSTADRHNITSIGIDDPAGILKFLCPDNDFINLLNQKFALNDEPLRLPSPDSK